MFTINFANLFHSTQLTNGNTKLKNITLATKGPHFPYLSNKHSAKFFWIT